MSWEAFRWTARTPAELLHTLGPHGVDELVRQFMSASWRELPDDRRTLSDLKRAVQVVFDRNMKVWSAIRKPSPAAFFENLLPQPADGFLRQALVLCWMMLPRAGGRQFSDVKRIVTGIFQRNLEAWDEDNRVFTKGRGGKKRAIKSAKSVGDSKSRKKPVAKKNVRRK